MNRPYVVATSNADTSLAAVQILDRGGNAYDAVLAALFTSFVSEPLLSSPGGGGYLLAKPYAEKPCLLDFFSQTPLKKSMESVDFFPIHGDFGDTRQEFHIGLGSVAVPGVFSGIHAIHKNYASMPLPVLAKNAIEKAAKGLLVDENFQLVTQILQPIIQQSSQARQLFGVGKHQLKAGDVFKNPLLSEFLQEFSQQPESWFYDSGFVQSICTDMKTQGGWLREEDFKNYKTIQRDPLSQNFGEWKLFSNSAPAQGGQYIVDQLREARLNDKKLPTLVNIVAAMQSIEKQNRAQQPQSSKGTTHISVIDSEKNAASLTISNGEGCGSMVQNAGFMLNNFLGEEDINPAGFHNWQANQRMISMMSPCILENPESIIALGTGGSNRIKTSLFQVIYALLNQGKTLPQAVNQPRMHFEKGVLDVEKGFASADIEAIQNHGFKVNQWQQRSLYFGGVNAVQSGENCLAVADSRRCGMSVISSFHR